MKKVKERQLEMRKRDRKKERERVRKRKKDRERVIFYDVKGGLSSAAVDVCQSQKVLIVSTIVSKPRSVFCAKKKKDFFYFGHFFVAEKPTVVKCLYYKLFP